MSTYADPVGAPVVLDRNSRLRFLLIEDSMTDSELIRALLEDEFPHAKIDAATSLQLALQRLAASPYDLVLADLTLPDADGGTVVRKVRDAYPNVTLMVLTGRVDGSLALWALAAGAQDYLVKGQHDGPHLAETVLHGLQRSRTERVTHSLLLSSLRAENESTEQLRELHLAESDFVATVSHELRTPLTSIAAYAELLQDEKDLSPRQSGFVDAIARNASRLGSLTDDLLLLSGFTSREQQMATDDVDLQEVVAQARDVLGDLGAGRAVTVDFMLPDHPLLVRGDAKDLERVVLNLVTNAIKFSERGGSVICRLSGTSKEVVLEVIDTGIGIPLDEQEVLFAKFFRGSAAREHAIEGTGLGLHIVASIVKIHGGNISVDSGLGRGATFTIRLPRLADTNSVAPAGDPRTAAPQGCPSVVLRAGESPPLAREARDDDGGGDHVSQDQAGLAREPVAEGEIGPAGQHGHRDSDPVERRAAGVTGDDDAEHGRQQDQLAEAQQRQRAVGETQRRPGCLEGTGDDGHGDRGCQAGGEAALPGDPASGAVLDRGGGGT